MIDPSYRHDLISANERTTPLFCQVCDYHVGIIWRGDTLYCALCYAASLPVAPPTLDDLTAASGNVVTANGALEIARKVRRC